jgi:probable F420-dependent oxidoreductase
VEIGISVPQLDPAAPPQAMLRFCRDAEAAGFDGLWFSEHVVVPREMNSKYTLTRKPTVIASDSLRDVMGVNLELLTTLAAAAAVTSRIRLGTSVAVLPLRNPVVNARQLATIDLLSGGRVAYGVGAGWLREEAEALGMPWDRRGARMEEHIALLRALWYSDEQWTSFAGEFSSFPDIDPSPRPAGVIPILIGGHSDRAIERAARIGDGWIGASMSPERLTAALQQLETACRGHHRAFEQLFLVCGTRLTFGPGEDSRQIVDRLGAYASTGIHHATVSLGTRDPSRFPDELCRWSEEVLPHLARA